MKRLIFLTAIVVAWTAAMAADVDLATAESVAKAFMARQVANGRLRAPAISNLKLAKAEASVVNPQAVDYYIFNADSSYVVVAGDDQAPEILMYGEDGEIDLDNIPPAMQWLLNKYKYQIDGLKAGTMKANGYSPKAVTAVAPMVTANWDQSAPYNNQCPTSGSTHAVTGCPATSLAMCYYKWKWPKTLPACAKINASSDYYGSYLAAPALSERTADWDNIIDEYTGPSNYSSTSAQKDAVAWLMRYAGQSIPNYQYATDASGATDPNILQGAKNMGYTDAQLLTLTTGYAGSNQNYTDAVWNNYMMNELQNGRPIEYLASDVSAGGHAFNVFGCDASGKYFVNWGWSGAGNGYCTLHNFTATVGSTGQSGSYVFNYGEAMIIGIAPPAGALGPSLSVNTTSLSFSTAGQQKLITLTGSSLTSDVTVTLNDPNDAFELSIVGLNPNNSPMLKANTTQTIPAASISEDNPVNIVVTLKAGMQGTFNGSVTLASNGAESVTVALNATAGVEETGGTASDAYLDIQKYATIDDAGWRTALVNNLYKYTEYETQQVGWLTLPVYGAFVGARYSTSSSTVGSGHPQAWIQSTLGTNSTYTGTTWTNTASATNPFNGSSTYFTANARAIGFNQRNNANVYEVDFYVTNVNAVKLFGKGNSRTASGYPARLRVYECTKNADGTVTASTTDLANQSNNSTSATFTLTKEGLDDTKVYKVVAITTCSYLYEIGFQTPLTNPSLSHTPNYLEYIAQPSQTITKSVTVTGKRLQGDVQVRLVDSDGVTSTLYSTTTPVISAADATAGAAVDITFTAPAEIGSYNAYAIFSTSGAKNDTIPLYGSCGDNGSAYGQYLDVQRYNTLNINNWGDYFFTNVYAYTENTADKYAWLTVPAYLSYAGWLAENQQWTAVSSYSSAYGFDSWDATDVFKGSTYFYGSDTPGVMGSSTYSNSSPNVAYSIFNVTNCSQVKAYCYNYNASSSYPAILQIVEMTENADGSLTEGSVVDQQTNTTSSGDIVLTSAELDPTKIYMVLTAGARSFYEEVAFKTPLDLTMVKLTPSEADFIAEPNTTVQETIRVTGRNLTQNVTLSVINDASSVYSVSPSTLTAAEAMAGADVTLTLSAPATEGSYRAQLIAVSGNEAADTIGIFGSVGSKGSAYSRYLNIGKYASIGAGNWYTSYIDNPYKYTKNMATGKAWLTMPTVMARWAWLYNGQNWLGASSGNYQIHQSETQGLEWDATDVFPGDDYYFTSTKSYGLGGVDQTNTDYYLTVYYVTNCSQVKTYGYNGSGTSSNYPSILLISEATENADGTLEVAETETDYKTSTTTSADFTLTSATLDPTKIYQVLVASYRGLYYEVAFETPIKIGTLAEMVADNTLSPGIEYTYTDGNVLAVMVSQDRKTLFCKDDQEYANKVYKTADQTDYLLEDKTINIVYKLPEAYDQSNWVALTVDPESNFEFSEQIVGSYLNGVTGTVVDLANPQLRLSSLPTAGTAGTAYLAGTPNVFIPSNFGATTSQVIGENNFFFMPPKPMEVARVTWALWNGEYFTEIPKTGTMNPFGLEGAFTINSSYLLQAPSLEVGDAYTFVAAIVRSNTAPSGIGRTVKDNTPSGAYTVYPLSDLTSIGTATGGTVTGITNVTVNGKEVKEVRYIDVTGRVSKTPWRGVNIVETIYKDGSKSSKKVRF